MKGKFIVFEGIDGTGKGTLLKLVTEELERLTNGHYHSTRLPGGSKVGEEVRKILFETVKTANISNDAIELLFMANTTHDTEREIRPRLDKGITVVIDRYHASHLAYAEERRPTSASVRQLSKSFVSVKPDLTVLLIGDPGVLLSRARGRGDGKQEAKTWNDVEIQRRVQDHYLRSCGGDPTTLVVDTTWADPAWTFEMLIRPRLRSLFNGDPETQIQSVTKPVPIRQAETVGRFCGVVEAIGVGGRAICYNPAGKCDKHLQEVLPQGGGMIANRQKIIKNSAKCLGCGDEIISTHRHDFVRCRCGALAVDGGKDYTKRCYNEKIGWKDTSIYEEAA